MQMIAGVVSRQQFCRRGPVANHGVEVNRSIIKSIGANPSVDRLFDRDMVAVIVKTASEWRDGGAIHANVVRV